MYFSGVSKSPAMDIIPTVARDVPYPSVTLAKHRIATFAKNKKKQSGNNSQKIHQIHIKSLEDINQISIHALSDDQEKSNHGYCPGGKHRIE